MDQIKKYEEEVKIEEYFEEKRSVYNSQFVANYFPYRLYELFKNLFKDLLIHRPDEPLDFLMEKLKNPKSPIRIFVVGPPGSNRKEISLSLSDHFGWPWINVGDLLNKEVSKKTEIGKEIAEAKKLYKYIRDELVIDLVKDALVEHEKEGKNWIIEGFPRTPVQYVALQKMGIVPTRIILLNIKKPSSQLKVKNNLISNATGLYGPELERVANNAIDEYYYHIKGVKSLWEKAQLIQEYDANTNKDDLCNEMAKMIQIRIDNPFRLPRIIILGPPGSGKTFFGEAIAKRFGLTFIDTRELLVNESSDEVVIPIMKKRLVQTDCKLNGYILDGYPMTTPQINLLKAINAKPSMVIILECDAEKCLGRIKERRYDPHTGRIINRTMDQDIDEDMYDRLIKLDEDNEDSIAARRKQWEEFINTAESAYNQCLLTVNTGEQTTEDAINNICEAIVNPMF